MLDTKEISGTFISSTRRRSPPAIRKVAAAVLVLMLCGCGTALERLISRPDLTGPPLDPSSIDHDAYADQETRMLLAFARSAGLQVPITGAAGAQGDRPSPQAVSFLNGLASDQWRLVTDAGMNRLDLVCEEYTAAIFRFARDQRTFVSLLNDLQTALTVALGLATAQPDLATGLIAGFGLAEGAVNSLASGVLFSMGEARVRSLVEQEQRAYRLSLTRVTFQNRPQVVRALLDYHHICLPQAIEARILNAVDDVEFRPSPTRNDVEGGVLQDTRPQNLPPTIDKPDPTLSDDQASNDGGTGPATEEPRPVAVVEPQRPGWVDPETGAPLTENQVAGIQRALCLADNADGQVNDQTLLELERYRRQAGGTTGVPPTVDELRILLGADNCPGDRRNAFERFMPAEDIRSMYAATGLAGTNGAEIGEDLRRRLLLLRACDGLSPPFEADDGLVSDQMVICVTSGLACNACQEAASDS